MGEWQKAAVEMFRLGYQLEQVCNSEFTLSRKRKIGTKYVSTSQETIIASSFEEATIKAYERVKSLEN